jgi:hypothetical protein
MWWRKKKKKNEIKRWITKLSHWKPQIIRREIRVEAEKDEVERWITKLSCWNPKTVRKEAIQSLVSLGDVRVIKPLIKVLKTWNKEIRNETIEALAQIGAPAVEPLIWRLLDTYPKFFSFGFTVARLHKGVTEALLRIGDPAVEPLIKLLAHLSFRKRAAEILIRIHGKQVEEQLINALAHENAMIRPQAVQILEKRGWKPDNDEQRTIYWVAKENIETVIFTHRDINSADQKKILKNPESVELTIPISSLKRIVIHTGTYDFHLVERFITYAVNYIGQKHLREQVEVHIYGDPEKLHPNLRNTFKNLCKNVEIHGGD